MLNKLILLTHEIVILNNPSRETISAGLGPSEQYGITIVALVVIGIVAYFIKRRKRKSIEVLKKIGKIGKNKSFIS